jgi:hypothetical protein
VAGLREVDPTAELLYFRNGRWVLGSVRWNAKAVTTAQRMVARAIGVIQRHVVQSKTGGRVTVDRRSRDRLEFCLLAMQGFRPIAEYVLHGEPDSAIVNDFRYRDWRYRHESDTEYWRKMDEALEAPRRAAHADLVDPARAHAAWEYVFTRSHPLTRVDDPMREVHRSGRVLVRSIS